jgi:hypothetical protein
LVDLRLGLCWRDEEVVLTLWSYFDESGHTEDPNVSVLALGGCISSVQGWQNLVPDWEDALRDFSVSEFHTKDFAHRRGEFKDWPEERRRALLARVVGLMNRDVDAYVGQAFPLPDEWREGPPGDLKARLRDPYHGCFIFCLTTTISYSAHSASRPTINVVLAHHPEHSGWANEVFHAMREEDGGDLLGSLSFASPAGLIQLQTADLVAYELQHYVTDTRYKGKNNTKKRWALEQFLTKPHYFKQMRFRREEQSLP